METSSNYWEDLRKQARQLENELDRKLVSFSKFCTSYSGRNGDQHTRGSRCDSVGSSQDSMLVVTTTELEQLLTGDYTQEFHKIKSNFCSLREREDLLGSVHRDIE
ncbi:Golgi SNAP receptor complex member 1 28 kDa [Takifugu flavidus]|uniref:Golgi SNAP receptor complex member 1 n=1 Tax=Takifugu flavidus TaxID=433684 RepID=A0A5C6P8P8_9TELE|nr:Golgi SNAP receptor complex member 1 28 kDa [Takifugu flavidus]